MRYIIAAVLFAALFSTAATRAQEVSFAPQPYAELGPPMVPLPAMTPQPPPTVPGVGVTSPSAAAFQSVAPAPAPVFASATTPTPPPLPTSNWAEEPVRWYFNVDEYVWREYYDGARLLEESGPIYTLGLVKRYPWFRYRLEVFGGLVHYDGETMDLDNPEPLESHTSYVGGRLEADLLYPLANPGNIFFLGVGTRFWSREIEDSVTASGAEVFGYEERWWTLYMYLGGELRRPLTDHCEIYGCGRIGLNPYNYQTSPQFGFGLHPKMGLVAQSELGLRWQRISLAGYFEAMTWGESPVVDGYLQPRSEMLVYGMRIGFQF